MQITLTNVSSPAVPIFVSDLYTTLQPGASVVTQRSLSQLSAMVSMQNYISAGQLTLKIEAEATEIASGTLSPIPPLFVASEFDTPPTAAPAGIMPATATVPVTVTYVPTTGASTVAGYLFNPPSMAVGASPRNVTITGGGTTAQCPTSAILIGFDAGGNPQTETITLTAGSGTGHYGWSSLSSVQFLGATGTAGTEEIGFGVVLGLPYAPILRAGMTSPYLPIFPEIVSGAVLSPSTGELNNTYHTYTPASAPNGVHSYAVYYEASQATY